MADTLPTLLTMLGLGVGEDMAGRTLTELLDPRWLAAHPELGHARLDARCARSATASEAGGLRAARTYSAWSVAR